MKILILLRNTATGALTSETMTFSDMKSAEQADADIQATDWGEDVEVTVLVLETP